MAATVIIFGRTRSTAPDMMAAYRSLHVNGRPSRSRRSSAPSLRYQINEHHDAGLGRDAGKGNEADRDGN